MCVVNQNQKYFIYAEKNSICNMAPVNRVKTLYTVQTVEACNT